MLRAVRFDRQGSRRGASFAQFRATLIYRGLPAGTGVAVWCRKAPLPLDRERRQHDKRTSSL